MAFFRRLEKLSHGNRLCTAKLGKEWHEKGQVENLGLH